MTGGPARGFVQMEAPAAMDAIDCARQKQWLDWIGTATGTTKAALIAARKELDPDEPSYPAKNKIGELLETDNLFGLCLARSYLAREPTAIPAGLKEQGDYWETHWHRKSNPAGKKQFVENGRRLNALLKWD